VTTGFGLTLLGQGFSFEAGLFADIPSYQACVTLEPTAACELDFTESITGDVGVYAGIAGKIYPLGVKAGPSVVVPLFSASLPETYLASKTTLPTTVGTITYPVPTNQPPYIQTASSPPSRVSCGPERIVTLTTATVYTITECASCLQWCPSTLMTELTLTRFLINYSTVCSAYTTVTASYAIHTSAVTPAAVVVSNPAPVAIFRTPIPYTI